MLTVIVKPKEISDAQKLLEENLAKTLPKRTGKYTIGFQGGNIIKDDLHADQNIWFVTKKDNSVPVPRYWNAFGTADQLIIQGSNHIAVEINVPLKGAPESVAGFFAKKADGKIVLLHSGKIGGGRKGIGKNEFLKWYKKPFLEAQVSGKMDARQAILISDINSKNIASNIASFVKAVAAFKSKQEYEKVSALSNSDLSKKATVSTKKPKRKAVEALVFLRNSYVVEYVKRRASGICDLCNLKALFSDGTGKPYLECHHLKWLADGGTDTIDNAVALCPNCHRKMHILNTASDFKKLEIQARVKLVSRIKKR